MAEGLLSRLAAMSGEPTFRRDLYRGTAAYYDRFRAPYPHALFEDLLQRAVRDSGGRLLDLAAGTGQIAFALADSFDEVWAVDQEPETVAFGRVKADGRRAQNMHWVVAAAEEVDLAGPFDLITIGNAFHRLRREVVARRVASWLAPGRCLAILWGSMPWRGRQPWQVEMAGVLEAWTERVGASDRIPAGLEEAMDRDPTSDVLGRAGLHYIGEFEFAATRDWSVAELTGLVYSTAFLNREALGDQAAAFEADLSRRLITQELSGVFRHKQQFAYELARLPE